MTPLSGFPVTFEAPVRALLDAKKDDEVRVIIRIVPRKIVRFTA
ncbi:hypothetical protein [Streptomyces chiangmaiensis]|uniref:Uncharacterized protein n=1 Tax=Streptomyces chiangmaiensis TaxID=766497 RepID=A0ABU7FPL7_9ACTN|nr:hypothetical protein [Streptomyces chiangmaiensis]MED7825803.1 hypothetical protein [Streptomyces chiangmaiensis]